MQTIVHNLQDTLIITAFVFVMMMLVDYIEVVTHGRMSRTIKGSYWGQYLIASALASTPGCLGAFMNVSCYMHGVISFGALAGGMIAASGDEAYQSHQSFTWLNLRFNSLSIREIIWLFYQ